MSTNQQVATAWIVGSQLSLTHQAPVVWKLALPQTAAPRYIRGPVHNILVLYFKCQPLSSGLHVFLYKVWTFRTCLWQPETIYIMLFDVRCGQENISKWNILSAVMAVLRAVTHAFRRVRKLRSACCRGASSLEKGVCRGRAAFDSTFQHKTTFSLKTRNRPMNFAIVPKFGNPSCYFVSD